MFLQDIDIKILKALYFEIGTRYRLSKIFGISEQIIAYRVKVLMKHNLLKSISSGKKTIYSTNEEKVRIKDDNLGNSIILIKNNKYSYLIIENKSKFYHRIVKQFNLR